MSKRTVRIILSLGLTVLLLALFLWNVDAELVAGALGSADAGLLALSAVLALLSYWMRAVRWALILRPVAEVRHSSVVLTTAVGYAAMALLPARMGDVIRPVLLARREKIPVSASLASILTERIFDLWTVLTFFLVFVIWPPAMALDERARGALDTVTLAGYAVGAGLVLAGLVLLGLLRYQERFVKLLTSPLIKFIPRWHSPATNFLNHFLDGLRVVQRPRELLRTLGASLVLWTTIYVQLHVLLLAFSIHLPFRAYFFLVTLTVLGLALPTPGGVGGFHKAIQVGLTLFFAVDLNTATGVALAHHAVCFVPITIIGLLCIPAVGVPLREVDAVSSSAAEPGG